MQKYLLVLLLAVAGCRRAEVSRYQVKKTAEMQAPLFAQERPRAEPIPDSPAASLPNALAWTLPRGWTERRAAGVRYATLKPAVGGKIDVSVVVLPIDERDLARARRSIKTRAGAVSVFDFVSDGNKKSRLLAAIVVSDESTWFIKMLGDESPVASSRPDFIHLLQSLHFDAAS